MMQTKDDWWDKPRLTAEWLDKGGYCMDCKGHTKDGYIHICPKDSPLKVKQ